MILTATIITRNEEAMIERCLKSLEGVDEIVVVDTSSQDNTGSYNVRTTTSAGGGAAHNNLQSYVVVYMWHRTA